MNDQAYKRTPRRTGAALLLRESKAAYEKISSFQGSKRE
jgi:hypothetical protein